MPTRFSKPRHLIAIVKHKSYSKLVIATWLLLSFLSHALAQETEKIFLSGKDFKHPVKWEFMCTSGANSNLWTTINVPSNWELQGFGTYTYGRWYSELNEKEPSKEKGFYKHIFSVPAYLKGKTITLNFGGVMTDTEVKINGKSVGEPHQGGFYQFSYNITNALNYGIDNFLEVHVSKHSENKSVNNAERKTDWWLFGGIYRPVWLEISPKSNIKHIAVDAKMNGTLTAELEFENLPKNAIIEACIRPIDGTATYPAKTLPLKNTESKQTINTSWEDIKTWDPETPNLYTLQLSLKHNGKILHTKQTTFGFRSLSFLKKDGIYVNGKKIIMKGINRHSIWPESGRSTDKAISILDVNLIKDMNMNAVRFHYPPDEHFLETCDSLGLFVLNELAGWQNAYDTKTSTKLIKEMVQRDVNHPSVIIWDHGNEGGWNTETDTVFHNYDPQKRIVVHPWSDFNGWDTHHYPTYLTGMHRFNNGENVFFPTEFMHGTYDNGIGAGLEDFWHRYKQSPLFAGGFLWALLDEAVLRTDWTNAQKYDSKGNLAADGVLGPHREKEGSFFSVKAIWAPIQFMPKQITSAFDGTFLIKNDYIFSDLNSCKLNYRVLKAHSASFYNTETPQVLANNPIHIPDIKPGETRQISLDLPPNFFEGDWLEISAFDKHNREIYTWSWPIHKAAYYADKFQIKTIENTQTRVNETTDKIILSSKTVNIELDKQTGVLSKIENAKGPFPFNNGPLPVGMKAEVATTSIQQFKDSAVCYIKYTGGIDHIKWTMYNDGRLKMDALFLKNAGKNSGFDGAFVQDKISAFGLTFSFPESGTKSIKWLGNGPYRVWKNRIKGTTMGLWEKAYNTTITGESFENLIYPEFKGYHANVIAASLKSEHGNLNIFSENDNLFLRLFTPDLPKNAISKVYPQPEFPEGDISFLYEIPGMRAFKSLEDQGPQSRPTNIRIKRGDQGIPMTIWFHFGSN